jgi:hypothetical protein
MKRLVERSLRPLLALLRCTRGTSAVTYLMVTGLVAIVAVSAFGTFDTRTSGAIQSRSALVAQLDGTEADHADSLPAEIANATGSNLVNAFEDGQLAVNALPYLATFALHGRGHGDDEATPHDPSLRDPPGHPEDPQTGLPCEGDACGVGSSQCFTAGTEVATPFGRRPIETLQAGDIVWSRDDDDVVGAAAARSGDERVARRVARVFVTPDREIVDVSLTGGDGREETLHATPQHPFRVAGFGWRPASELASGDRVDTEDGHELTVVAQATHATRETVYNLEVEASHTYFVGEHLALVHNRCRLTDSEGQLAVDAIHKRLGPIAQKRSTTTISELEDGTLLVTNSSGVNPAERDAARSVLIGQYGFSENQIRFPNEPGTEQPVFAVDSNGDVTPLGVERTPNPFYVGDRTLTAADDPRVPASNTAGHHGEQQGAKSAMQYGLQVDRQWSSNGSKNGGAACAQCERVQTALGIKNGTGFISTGGKITRGGRPTPTPPRLLPALRVPPIHGPN